ncbi:MAG: YopX family protein [Promethearchaeota archaeon]
MKRFVKYTPNIGLNINGYVYNLQNGIGGNEYYELSQFTGLKDKKGKEIYEGDIVQWEDSRNNDMYSGDIIYSNEPVEFKGGAFYPICTMDEKEFEIIGNIYENPELLK